MIIGEAPGKDEVAIHQPFVGYTGQRLDKILDLSGHTRKACFIGNISQHRPSPTSDKIHLLKWDGAEIQSGLEQLRRDVATFNPHVILLLGNLALKAAKDYDTIHPLVAKRYANKVSAWRGSLFTCTEQRSPFFNRKCVASYHPAYCLRDFEKMPLLVFDIKRAVKESSTPILTLPQRTLHHTPTYAETVHRLHTLMSCRTLVALDIEGGVDSMSCISFATTPTDCFIVPLSRKSGGSYFLPHEEIEVWRMLARVLENPLIPKCLQNSLYDRFVLAYSYGIRVQGVVEDTMLKWWELYAELPKSLGTQTSILTNEPYYKQERKSNDDATFYEYCCKDSAVTLEIANRLDSYITGVPNDHYRLNVGLLNPLLYMELRGIRYDSANAATRRAVLQRSLYETQAELNALIGLRLTSKQHLTDVVYGSLLVKKAPPSLAPESWPMYGYSNHKVNLSRLVELVNQPSPTLSTLGEIETILGVGMNVGSSAQMCNFLYGTLGLPQQFEDKKEDVESEDEEDDGITETPKHNRPIPASKKETKNYEALIKLSKLCKHGSLEYQFIQYAIVIQSLATRQRMLRISADGDGRIRCGYNIVGSNTGRITCYESPTGSGYNLQTIPNYTSVNDAPGGVLGDRDLFIADPDHWFFQCDLKGADGWTVAAYSALLGDRTMLDDYLYGLKPANIICLMLRGAKVDFRDRAALKAASKMVEKDAWDYFACKRVQHGASYLEGPFTISRNILKDSEGKCVMSTPECKKLSDLFFQRYWGVRKYHDYIARSLKSVRGTPYLIMASGHKRYFFGRPDEILTKAVAAEPQHNTTYATNLALRNLWNDEDNRTYTSMALLPLSLCNTVQSELRTSTDNYIESLLNESCRLRIEPLHQVHDALCGQFLKTDTSWSIGKIKSYFANPLRIAQQTITIPFDGAYGESWGSLKEGVI